jgi:hexosaminidase
MFKQSFSAIAGLLFLLATIFGCQQNEPKHTDHTIAVIPQPVELTKKFEGTFQVNKKTRIIIDSKDTALSGIGKYLKSQMDDLFNLNTEIIDKPADYTIYLGFSETVNTAEGYNLTVDPEGISILGKEPAGIFHGVQSLLQLMETNEGSVPLVDIKDYPRFVYRGMHLDVGRHMFPVEFIKEYIDYLAKYKYNYFHWHLTEDQGWRIEIKKYPKLQEIAAYRKETLIGHYSDKPHQFDGQRYGGYYTQEEVKEIVAYAADRYITVIPEIEMPGHAQAALAAYPELSCNGGDIEPATKWGVFEEVYCPTEETFEFLENVLLEVFELFPSKYIHIGGDECPKTAWENSDFCQQLIKKEGLKNEHELQSYFIQRMENSSTTMVAALSAGMRFWKVDWLQMLPSCRGVVCRAALMQPIWATMSS